MEEPWDGPAPEEPREENIKGPASDADKAVGLNELRVVRKIEESLQASKGPRIQVIKSRELRNAKSFAEKVYRVLKLHGYKLQPLDRDNINKKVERSNTDSLTVYTIDEPTIKEILGSGINESERPIRELFNNSMLSYLKAPVLIVVVTDAFYGETGLQSYAQSLSENNGTGKTTAPGKKEAERPERNRATPISLYLAAIAFLASGINSIFGSYISINSAYGTYLPLPIIILLISIAAIVGRAISLGNERKGSIALVVASILLFIALTLLQLFSSYLPGYVANSLNISQISLFSGTLPFTELALAIVFYVLAMMRFMLYLGRGSGKGAYALTIFGIVWITFIIGINLPQVNITNHNLFPPVYNLQPIVTSFPTDFPVFGFNYQMASTGTPQYMVPMNALILIGNFIMALGLLLAAKGQKALFSGSSKQK